MQPINLIGRKAPFFQARAVQNNTIIENFSLEQFIGQKYVVLFFYPKDFTFVCPTELHAFEELHEEFTVRDTMLIGCSTDSEFSHLAWLEKPKREGGIQGVTYPLIADINKTIAAKFGVLAGNYSTENGTLDAEGELVAYRGLFLIDKEGVVQHLSINNMPLGRNVREALRLIDALRHFEAHGEVCPSNWNQGQAAMKPNREGLLSYYQS